MKPDWKDAPEWANYYSIDSNGMPWWHQYEPILSEHSEGYWKSGGETAVAMPSCKLWKDSLEQRP